MRGQFVLSLPILIVVSAIGQQSPKETPLPMANSQGAAPTTHYTGPEVTAPALIPQTLPIESSKKCVPVDGAVTLSGVVDADGSARDMKTIASGNADIANLAVHLVNGEKFAPGTYRGVPAAVAVTIEFGLQTCMKRGSGGSGSETTQLMLRSHPVQALSVSAETSAVQGPPNSIGSVGPYQVGGSVSPPVPLNQPEAEYSDYARRKKISGICLIGLVIDADGMPQNVHVVKGIGAGLDENAVEAVKTYRFKPAMKDGKVPVPVAVNVEVNFRLHKKW